MLSSLPSASCECPTFEFPGESAAGEQPPSRTSGLQARRGAAHFPGAPLQRHQGASPAPAVVSFACAPDTTASATFSASKEGGMRGREVQARAPASRFEGRLSLSALVLCEHPAASRSIRCWVVPCRDSSSSAGSVRRVPSLHSSVSLRLGYTRPLFLHTSAGVNPVRSVPGSRDTALPRCWRRQSPDKPALDCAGATVPGFAINVLLLFEEWAVPAQAGEAVCQPHHVGLCRGLGA